MRELEHENGTVRSETVKVNQFPQVNHEKGPACAGGLGGGGKVGIFLHTPVTLRGPPVCGPTPYRDPRGDWKDCSLKNNTHRKGSGVPPPRFGTVRK